MTGGLTKTALRNAVREKVFPEAQKSVLHGLELFFGFVEKHQWQGKDLSAQNYRLPSGAVIKIEPIGRYFSKHLNSEFLIALQPRQDGFPDHDQFCMWRSALRYQFCRDVDNAMIVDLSKSPVSQKRQLREVTSRKFPLLGQSELNERLEMVAASYLKAVELVPERPARFAKGMDEPDFGLLEFHFQWRRR